MEAGLVQYEQDNNPHCYQDSEGNSRCYWVPTVLGIASWVSACGYVEYPDVYGRVTRALNWIQSITGKYIEIFSFLLVVGSLITSNLRQQIYYLQFCV